MLVANALLLDKMKLKQIKEFFGWLTSDDILDEEIMALVNKFARDNTGIYEFGAL